MEQQGKANLSNFLYEEILNAYGFKLKTVSDMDGCQKFMNFYNNERTIPVSLKYLEQCNQVKIIENNLGKVLACYLVNDQIPLRYFNEFTPEQLHVLLQSKNIPLKNIAEIACIKFSFELIREIRDGINLIYYCAVTDALNTQKGFLIGGSKDIRTWQKYETLLHQELYYGEVKFESGISRGKIVYDSRINLEQNFLEYQKNNPIKLPNMAS